MSKVIVNKENLKLVEKYIDAGNPKFELDYLFVDTDNENLVATDTRTLAIAKCDTVSKGNFYVHKKLVSLAIKQTKAIEYHLEKNKITCLDRDDIELVVFSLEKDFYNKYEERFHYPDYKRIIPKETKHKIPFVSYSAIEGILNLNKIVVDTKRIPTKSTRYLKDYDGGFIKFNDAEMPITIEDNKDGSMIIIMPIVDKFEVFREGN